MTFRKVAHLVATIALMRAGLAREYAVSPSGQDTSAGTESAPWRTIQKALNVMEAGDTVSVGAGTYAETLRPVRSGTASAPIIVRGRAPAGQAVTIDGTGRVPTYQGLIHVEWLSFVRFENLELVNVSGNDVSAVRVVGVADGVQINNCHIHNVRGIHAMGVTVYGTASTPISNFTLSGCDIHDCQPYPSEAVTMNGNVYGAQILNNMIHDVNNIGIDLIGGEPGINRDLGLSARACIVRGNVIERCLSPGGGATAVGIYVDGGDSNLIEGNIIRGCDVGLQVGAENRGTSAGANIFRSNVIAQNRLQGIILGAESDTDGRAIATTVTHNLFYRNDTTRRWAAEVQIEWGSSHRLANNIFWLDAHSPQAIYWADPDSGGSHHLSGNMWWGPSWYAISWNGRAYESRNTFATKEKEDGGGFVGDPMLVDPALGDYHLRPGSPAIDRGAATLDGAFDMDGSKRVWGAAADWGPDEVTPIDEWTRTQFPGAQGSYPALWRADTDADDTPNLIEYAAGTDPRLSSSTPHVGFTLKRFGGKSYPTLEWQTSPTATDTVWVPMESRGGDVWTEAITAFYPAVLVAGSGATNRWSITAVEPVNPATCQCLLRFEIRTR
jgi:Protein of unknown function (DUF1565)